MDAGTMAMFVPIVAIAAGALITIERMKSKRVEGGGDVAARIDALERELTDVRHELIETQERLDFAERMLAKQKDARPLP